MENNSGNSKEAVSVGNIIAALQSVVALLSEFASAAAQDITEVDNAKQDKVKNVSVTIPETGWNTDSNADYPKYYDIAVNGVTSKDHANVYISTGSSKTAKACGMCSTNETLSGKIRIRAVKVPTAAITAEYNIEKGAD